jgi:hypothetical protein
MKKVSSKWSLLCAILLGNFFLLMPCAGRVAVALEKVIYKDIKTLNHLTKLLTW